MCTAVQPLSVAQLLTALCCVLVLVALAVHVLAPATYTRHRTAITTARRLLPLPYIKYHSNRQMQFRGPVAALLHHFLVQTGALQNIIGAVGFLNGWRVGELLLQQLSTQQCA
jgi:hypothetical protein